MVKYMGPVAELPGYKAQLRVILAVCPPANNLISLTLSSFI